MPDVRDFPIKSVIKGDMGEKQSFFQGHKGHGRKKSFFPGTMHVFLLKHGPNYSHFVVKTINLSFEELPHFFMLD